MNPSGRTMVDPPVIAAVSSIAAAIAMAAACFRAAGIEAPLADARILAAEACGFERLRIVTRGDEPIGEHAALRFAGHIHRRLCREPVSRILGRREFFGHRFHITPATLDPRPDSECVVEAALALLGERRPAAPQPAPRILDVGTGSGCLILSLLAALPEAIGVATDISAAALAVAAGNAGRLALADRVAFRLGSGLAPAHGLFDLVVSNPPYIASSGIAALAPEVAQYDPLAALDGGADGLAVYRLFASEISRVISDGWVVFEVGAEQADAVAALLSAAFPATAGVEIRMFKDMAGMRRCVAASPRQ